MNRFQNRVRRSLLDGKPLGWWRRWQGGWRQWRLTMSCTQYDILQGDDLMLQWGQ